MLRFREEPLTLPIPVNPTTGGGNFVVNGGQDGPITIASNTGDDINIVSNGGDVIVDGSLVVNSSVRFNYEKVTSFADPDYYINDTHYLLEIGTTNITNVYLPEANDHKGRTLIISNCLNTKSIFVRVGNGSGDLIDGVTFVELPLLNDRVVLVSSGENKWFLL